MKWFLVLLLVGCGTTAPDRIQPVSECSYVFGGPGNQFLGCRSDPFGYQIVK